MGSTEPTSFGSNPVYLLRDLLNMDKYNFYLSPDLMISVLILDPLCVCHPTFSTVNAVSPACLSSSVLQSINVLYIFHC